MKTHHRSLLHFFFIISLSLVSCDYDRDLWKGRRERAILPADAVHEGWYFSAAERVVIEGTINGDAYVAGGSVEVDGTINGDLLVAGGQVTINGKVSDDIRVCGGSVHLGGKVGKSVTAAGGTVVLGKSGEIGGNLLAAGGNVELRGAVAGNVKIAAGDAGVTGTINKNADFGVGSLSILPGAKIGGNLRVYVAKPNRVEIADGTVSGKVDIKLHEVKKRREILGFPIWRFWLRILWSFGLLATGFVLLLLFPKQFSGIGTNITKSPGESILWGLGGLILIPVAMGILFVTVIGVPLGLFLLVSYLWLMYLSQLSFGVALGQRLFRQEGKGHWRKFWTFAVGLLVVQILTFISIVGPIVVIAGLIFGFGAILLVLKSEMLWHRRAEG